MRRTSTICDPTSALTIAYWPSSSDISGIYVAAYQRSRKVMAWYRPEKSRMFS
jgi:hypothetical protein